MSTLSFFEIETWQKEFITAQLPRHKLIFSSRPLTKSSAARIMDAEVLAVFVYSSVTKEIIGKLPKLKLVTTMTTGFDHIDLQACRDRGITVTNVPSYGENTVAEHTFALILALSRKIVQSVNNTRLGDFASDGLRGFDLKGKTLGVIGTGHIGRHVIRMANGFQMKTIAYDKFPDPTLVKQLGFSYTTLGDVLRQSDIITLHCPYNKGTHHIINKENITSIKKGARLINTARGGLVETEALLKALQRGQLGGAGLDVLEEEGAVREEAQLLTKYARANLKTVLENHILLHHPRVIITPHNAFNSREALDRILNTTMENIKAYQKGKPVHVVG